MCVFIHVAYKQIINCILDKKKYREKSNYQLGTTCQFYGSHKTEDLYNLNLLVWNIWNCQHSIIFLLTNFAMFFSLISTSQVNFKSLGFTVLPEVLWTVTYFHPATVVFKLQLNNWTIFKVFQYPDLAPNQLNQYL